MTFVAAPAAGAPPAVLDTIAGDGWWPDLSIAAFRDARRVGTLVTDGRVRDALAAASLSVAIQLMMWRAARELLGAATLAGVLLPLLPATIGDEATAIVLWRRAVYSSAAADLVDTHHDISATESWRRDQDVRMTAVDELRRDATAAIRDLLGRTRAKVALI